MNSRFLGTAFGVALMLIPTLRAADDLLIADFEGIDYGSWTATGEAFGTGPAHGTLPGQMAVGGFQGKGLVNSFHKGDDSTGTLTSPPFTIQRNYIRFLIGGGKNPDRLSMNLLVDGKVVRQSTGPNDTAGGTEALAAQAWNVSDLTGKHASIQIVDQAKGGWGHINVDHIVQTDRKLPEMRSQVTRNFVVKDRYLNLPIQNGAPKRVVTTFVDGVPVVRNDMELAPGEPDWWAPMDVSAWKGKTVSLQVDRLPEDSQALARVEASNNFPGQEDLYREPLRGQFHFSPKRGWNNDPNGMVYYRGEYHLFFQHNPYGWDWGNMHWGHAVSRDMVHWRELGDVLAPDSFGPMFSGSAVVDWKNTSGLGRPGQPPLVLLYTAAGNPTVQCLAYSTDGRNFTKYSGNPILKEITGGNRDPKVIWHEPSQKWVMTLYVEVNKVHTIQFFTSSNLKDWTHVSTVDGFFECPDFFELPIDGNPSQKRWVLTAASSEYRVGHFDGTRFASETDKLPGHQGSGFYAAQTFSDIPSQDGRRIQIGWFQTPTRGMTFNQSMTIPLELKLTATTAGPRLTWTPIKELESLRRESHSFQAMKLGPGAANPLAKLKSELVELRCEFEPESTGQTLFHIRGATMTYDAQKQELSVNSRHAHAPLRQGKQRLTIYCDRTGLEVFASDGLTYMPLPFIPKAEDRSLGIEVKGAPIHIHSLQVHELKSAWKVSSAK